MRVAFIHDWLNGMRGGERCLEALCELYPKADLYSLFYEPGTLSPTIESMCIQTSFIQKLPGVFKKYRHYLPLFPVAIEQFDLRNYELVVSLSHCVANGVITRPQCCHIGYTFTPMRYAWDLYQDYFGGDRATGVVRWVIPYFMNYLRIWDTAASKRVDHFIAISNYIKQRINKHYRRPADVIYPPVDTDFYTPSSEDAPGEFYLIVSAFAPYKKIDLAIEAFNRLGYALKIIGRGQEAKRLQSLARPNIELLGALSDEDVRDHYRRCKALIFPGEEDFGIVPAEAQACGRPVIAFARGGATETTVEKDTAVWFHEQSVDAIAAAVKEFESRDFSPTRIRNNAVRFAKSRFQQEMYSCIEEKLSRSRQIP
ncbi:glycosyl transferase [candidate division KSB3 bacterium]|uniref:Glycosyl transferase n=1 Tax=candidate division KSB3 bacterium TaxID=2044937 RepID=A0A2G6EA04_9BACT|nr:MAG: glycosyl transferase [candidate division KSB3 bacterium]PIE30967.1 MAG: glycosyl transferase [candidate division KSB3 bacterium]